MFTTDLTIQELNQAKIEENKRRRPRSTMLRHIESLISQKTVTVRVDEQVDCVTRVP